MDRLQLYFVPEDVFEITRIKTSSRNEVDFIAWHPEKHGFFTVKSAYRLGVIRSMQEQDRRATSSRPDGEWPNWKLIWNFPVLPKVRILAWKFCRNALATQRNMVRLGMATLAKCVIYCREDEDTFHAFIRCPHARSLL